MQVSRDPDEEKPEQGCGVVCVSQELTGIIEEGFASAVSPRPCLGRAEAVRQGDPQVASLAQQPTAGNVRGSGSRTPSVLPWV